MVYVMEICNSQTECESFVKFFDIIQGIDWAECHIVSEEAVGGYLE